MDKVTDLLDMMNTEIEKVNKEVIPKVAPVVMSKDYKDIVNLTKEKGNNEINNSFTSLTETERDILLEILQSRASELIAHKGKYDFRQIRQIVPIDEWINDEYYVPFTKYIYPYWKQYVIDIFKGQEGADFELKFNEVVVGGSIGIGKSTLATILLMRMIYIISCFENIQTFYGLMPGSPIYICIISVNREVAEATLYGDLLNKIDMTPYFEEKFPRNKRIGSLIAFPNDLTVIFGSNHNSVIGKNVISFAADEMGFRAGDAETTNRFYAYLLARNKSRFIYGGGKNGSLAILLSSATTSTSIVEQRKNEALTNNKITARDPSLWEVKPDAYSKQRFPIFTGSASTEPCIIENYDTLITILKEEGINDIDDTIFRKVKTKQEEYNVILQEIKKVLPDYIKNSIKDVPIELYNDFRSNLIDSMQNLAGVAVSPSGRLFTSRRIYNEAIDNDIYYPFTSDQIYLTTRGEEGILDYIKSDIKTRVHDLDIPRFIHIDGSFAGDTKGREADHTGISCCHITGVKQLSSGVYLPLIEVDFQLEVLAPKSPNQTSLEKVLNVIFILNNLIGYNIKDGSVTYDGFQSMYSLQLLEKDGYSAYQISMDRTDAPYLDFVNMLYEHRIKMRNHKTSQKELFELIHYRDRGKVDHPSDGSKDLMDSLCGCVQAAIRSDYFKKMAGNVVSTDYIDAEIYLRELEREEALKVDRPKDFLDIELNQIIDMMKGGRTYNGG